MYLKKVRLTNIKCFAELGIDFGKDDGVRLWTTLFGKNGLGKSTLLQAMGAVLAGPSAVSSVIVYAQQATAWFDMVFLAVTIVFVAGSVWLALLLAEPISVLLGRNGIDVITRLLGLLLAAIAIEYVTGGLVQLLPGLAAC